MRVIIVLALIGTAIAVPRHSQRIVGGSPTTVQQYPYMSNMQYLFFGVFWAQRCGGALITSTTVLSAAHCYIGDPPNLWRVRLGSSFASSGGSVHQVSQLIVHEGYTDETLNNDVAIVRLATPAILGGAIAVARIAGPNYNLPDGTVVTAIGWGDLTYGGSAPEQLNHVDVYTINHQQCVERYAYLKTQPRYEDWPDVTPAMLCSGVLDIGGRDACQGDSGGPLAHAGDIIVGVTSWGYRCAHYFYPGVNARVSYLSDWIVANGST